MGPVLLARSASFLPGGESVEEGSLACLRVRPDVIASRHTPSGIEANIPRPFGRRPYCLLC